MDNEFRVQVKRGGDATVLAVSGELDLASSPALEAELARVDASEPKLVVVDLRELDFMDSTGLSVLVRAHQRLHDAGTQFGLVNGPPQVQRLLSLTGIGERIIVGQTLEELLGSSP